jgi:hypothetical protein
MTVTISESRVTSDEISALVSVSDRSHRLAFRSSGVRPEDMEGFLPIALLPAMRIAEPVHLNGVVSAQLLAALPQIQDVFATWDPSLRRVPVQVDSADHEPHQGTGVGCFFTGGVDSFYSVLRHRDEITHLIFVLGFDVPLRHRARLREEVVRMAREVAAALDKRLVLVETNLRPFSDDYAPWWLYHGSAIAGVGLLFQRHFHQLIIPATHTYADLFPWGTHPLLDPLWGTESTEFVHDGCETTRVDKVGAIASSDLAMQWLRVCLANPNSAYNCGRCEKCLRTMISLHVHGALGRCRTFPSSLNARAVSNVILRDANERSYMRENLLAVQRLNSGRSLERGIRRALRGQLRRKALTACKQAIPDGIRRRVRARRWKRASEIWT